MKFVCSPQELSNALNIVAKALPQRSDIPVLEGIKIVAEGNVLTLSATDIDIFIQKKINAEILLEGETVVIGKFFVEYIRKLVYLEEITIEKLEEKQIIIKYGENEGVVQCLNTDSYPIMTNVNDDKTFKIKEKDLKELIEKTSYAVAIEDSRPILKGCLFEATTDIITSVALDGYRLALCKKPIFENKVPFKIVINAKLLNDISKIMEENDEFVKINIQDNKISLDLKHTIITTRLLEGEYMKYQQIIPKDFNTKIIVNSKEFENCLDRASLISKSVNSNYIKLIIEDNMVTLSSSSNVGNIKEYVKCAKVGNDMSIAFNSRYLFDALNRIKEENMEIQMRQSKDAALIKGIDNDNYLFIVLPVRLL